MIDDEAVNRERWRTATREQILAHQLERLNVLLADAIQTQPFYQAKLAHVSLPLVDMSQFAALPFLEKSELSSALPATICGWKRNRYVHAHQTSGTTGNPILVLDSAQDWQWWLSTWQYVLDAAQVTTSDTAFMAFSYGPFIGFWSAHDALIQRGALVVPGGGMTSLARLHAIAACDATILCCTPTYALHLATVAKQAGINITESAISRIIVAGETGGSIPEVRQRIETAWGASVIDHCGATEVGPWGVGNRSGTGVHVIESEFIAETLIFDAKSPSGRNANPGELAELVFTGLGRHGAPAIRYRTGDLVRAEPSSDPENQFMFLRGGVVGRIDDMVVIRGVNVFPASVEAIIRRVAGDAEYRVSRSRHQEMEQLRIEVEGDVATSRRLDDAFREQLGLRIEVTSVDNGTLPRFEAKAKRWVTS